MKIAIVDDERKVTDLLEGYIRRFEQEHNVLVGVSVFHHPNDFLGSFSESYDLILMDIEMPGLNGIETAREIRRMDKRVVIIFITNMAQYAINGYEVEALDFVIKPLAYADFVMKLQKAMRYIARNQDKKIAINTSDGVVHIDISDLLFVEVIRHYLVFHTLNGDYTVRGVMKETEIELSSYHFVRSNHCYLVNLRHVETIRGNMVKVGSHDLQISRNKKNEFLMEFTRYIGGM